MEEIHSNPMTFKTLKIACTLSVHGSFLNLIFSLPWLVVGFNTWFIAEAHVMSLCIELMR